MKVLTFISEDFYFLSHRKKLLLGLKKLGIETCLATRLGSPSEKMTNLGLRVYSVDIDRKSLSPISVLSAAVAYKKIIDGSNPDILFAVALKPILAASIARYIGPNQPILCAFAGLGTAFAGNSTSAAMRMARFGMEIVFRPLLNHARCYCLFQNRDDAELFWSRCWTVKERSYVIPGAGVELNNYHPKKWQHINPVRFLFAGRLLWDKGIKDLVEACSVLKKKGLSFDCQIAGLPDNTNKAAVPLSFMEESQRAGLIHWLGARDDVPALMADADCFVFPTIYREGVPKVLLEASAAGLPMITTDMPGCRDVVKPGFNGLIVPPKNPGELADAMEQCIRDRSRLSAWGANARRQAEKEYGVDRVIQRHIEIFDTIAERHGLGGRTSRDKLATMDCPRAG